VALTKFGWDLYKSAGVRAHVTAITDLCDGSEMARRRLGLPLPPSERCRWALSNDSAQGTRPYPGYRHKLAARNCQFRRFVTSPVGQRGPSFPGAL